MVKIDKQQFERETEIRKLIDNQAAFIKAGQGQFGWKIHVNDQYFDFIEKVLPFLLKVTNNHCAYCDSYYPSIMECEFTLDRLESVNISPEKAYSWHNLYPVCTSCKEARMKFPDDIPLRPDDEHFDFLDYFEYCEDDHHIKSLLPDDNSEASITIKSYNLNRKNLVREREKLIKKLSRPNDIIELRDKLSFRFLSLINGYKNPIDIINKYLA